MPGFCIPQNGVFVIDGATGTMIQDLGLTDEDFGGSEFKMLSDLLVFSRPDDQKHIHVEYLKAGALGIETNSFGASELRLCEYDFSTLDVSGFQNFPSELKGKPNDRALWARLMSRESAAIAKEAIRSFEKSPAYDGKPRYVLGSVGPSNHVISCTRAQLRRATYDQIFQNFKNQALGLLEGGVDAILFETQQDMLELKAAIHGAQDAMKDAGHAVPLIAQVTVDAFCKMQIFNTDILAALATIQGIGVDVFGINCSIGPDLMEKTVQKLSQHSRVPISVVPNAGLPVSENGQTVFKLSPQDFARELVKFVTEYGVQVVGGCCGTRPDHIRALSEALKGVEPLKRELKTQVLVSGPQNAVTFCSDESLIRIGERLNVRGSLKVRKAVESEGDIDFEALEEVANEQTKDLGLDVIDVCMDSNVVNTEQTLVDVIQNLTTDFSAVFCLDSFSVEALLEAIQVYPGRPVLNSISLEEYAPGVDKIDAVVGPTKHHDPVYIALATGPQGPAVTANQKFNLCRRIYNKCLQQHGLRPDQLVFDVNAFPIGSESDESVNFAVESIDSIKLVKSLHPDVKVSMGVGNLTNGLAKKPYMRKVLTSVFVAEARKQGLDAAIINPNHYVPVESLEKTDVDLACKVIFERDMDAFSELEDIAERKKGHVVKKSSYEDLSTEEAICQKVKDGHKEKSVGTIVEGDFSYDYMDAVVPQVAEALKQHEPLRFINEYLMAAMKDLGDGFGRGEVSLPHLLKSADVMKHAMGYIESLMKHKSGVDVHEAISYKGVVVLGTVYQDVHSIGKDLVKTLLENYGYRVIDLGVQTPLERFIEEAKKHDADAIGMSALLVQTSNHMITVAKMVKEHGLDVHLLIGGAPVNHRHAAYVSMCGGSDASNQLSSVFYCPSGMDGVNVMNTLMESEQKCTDFKQENLKKLQWHYEQAQKQSQKTGELLDTLPRRVVDVSVIKRDPCLYQPPQRQSFSLQQFLSHIDTKTLFSLNWRYGGKASWEKKGTSTDKLMAQLKEWAKRCDENNWLTPQCVYGVWPCLSQGDELVLFDVEDTKQEVARIPFTVVIGGDQKDIFSAAQYFQPDQSKGYDVVGLQISSCGVEVDAQIQTFKEQGDSESALLLQGLSDRVAEDMAEWCHKILRSHAGLSPTQGTRYSPGYPGLKELAVNKTLLELLKASNHLGVKLTDAYEFWPTGSTGAVVCFHQQSRYD